MHSPWPGASSGGGALCGSHPAPRAMSGCFLESCKSIRNTFVKMKKRVSYYCVPLHTAVFSLAFVTNEVILTIFTKHVMFHLVIRA